MKFLHVLSELRSPFWDNVFLMLTEFGGEILFTVFIMVTLWCLDRRAGYWMFFAWIFGSASSQFLKVCCAVPRPWVRDPAFSPVEEAIADAGGYSFPSGHTQSAAGLYGSAFVFIKRKGLRAVFVVLTLLTGVSRMYLGVHTPADVAVGLLIGVLPVVYMGLAVRAGSETAWRKAAQGLLLLLCGAFLLYCLLSGRAKDAPDEFFLEGLSNAWKLAGAAVGFVLSWAWTQKHPYETKAPLPAQVLKCLVGGAIALGIKSGLKAPLLLLFGGSAAADGLRYFLLAVFACLLWPKTFSFWNKLIKPSKKTNGKTA